MTLWALVINDRHLDTEVRLFSDPGRAVAALEQLSQEAGWPLDDPAASGGGLPWLASCSHRSEGDNAHVVAVEVES